MGTQQVTQPLSPELQKIADELKQQEQAAQADEQRPAEEVSIALETGQVYKGRNWEEVANKIAEAQRSASQTIRQQREELERRQDAGAKTPTEAAAATPAGFDPKRYWELMNEDPRRASRYALAADLGIPEEQVPTLLRGAIQTAAAVSQNAHLAQFYQDCPDYPASKEGMEKMMAHMEAKGRRGSADDLKLTWIELRESGELKPLETDKKQSASPQGSETPPPTLTGGGGVASDPLAAAEEKLMTLPPDKAEALLKELGLK